MKVLGIDPSSTCVGYGLIDGLNPEDLLDGGRLVPSMAHEFIEDLPEWLQHHLDQQALAAYRRIHSVAADLLGLLEESQPDRVVVEIPSGKAGTGSRRGARGSLTTYGLAAGIIIQVCSAWDINKVVPVTERQWTARQGDKPTRQSAIAGHYGDRYRAVDDRGGDVSDAIGIARWWMAKA